jgi:hypothetical protein
MQRQRTQPSPYLLPIVTLLSIFEISIAFTLLSYLTYYVTSPIFAYFQQNLLLNQHSDGPPVSRFTDVDRGLLVFWLPVGIALVFRAVAVWAG